MTVIVESLVLDPCGEAGGVRKLNLPQIQCTPDSHLFEVNLLAV